MLDLVHDMVFNFGGGPVDEALGAPEWVACAEFKDVIIVLGSVASAIGM